MPPLQTLDTIRDQYLVLGRNDSLPVLNLQIHSCCISLGIHIMCFDMVGLLLLFSSTAINQNPPAQACMPSHTCKKRSLVLLSCCPLVDTAPKLAESLWLGVYRLLTDVFLSPDGTPSAAIPLATKDNVGGNPEKFKNELKENNKVNEQPRLARPPRSKDSRRTRRLPPTTNLKQNGRRMYKWWHDAT